MYIKKGNCYETLSDLNAAQVIFYIRQTTNNNSHSLKSCNTNFAILVNARYVIFYFINKLLLLAFI